MGCINLPGVEAERQNSMYVQGQSKQHGRHPDSKTSNIHHSCTVHVSRDLHAAVPAAGGPQSTQTGRRKSVFILCAPCRILISSSSDLDQQIPALDS